MTLAQRLGMPLYARGKMENGLEAIKPDGTPCYYEVPIKLLNIEPWIDADHEIVSAVIQTWYLPHLVIGLTASESGNLSVQRYIDTAGRISQGKPLTSSLTANKPSVIDNNDGKAFGSLRLTISNAGFAKSILNGFVMVLVAG